MLDGATQASLNAWPTGTREEVRDYAKARLVALGWPNRTGTQGEKAPDKPSAKSRGGRRAA